MLIKILNQFTTVDSNVSRCLCEYNRSKFVSVITFILFLSQSVLADDYHYKDVIVGERASGLGGSYIAISDDPSGLWYNPAGIIFSYENYFSLSANAYNETTEVYKNVFKSDGYTYRSKGLIPNFFGVTQTAGNYKWGFSIIVPKSDLFDQDDEINDISTGTGKAKSLSRKFFKQNNVTGLGLGGAGKVNDKFTYGLSLFGMIRDDKTIDNQLVTFNADADGKERFLILNRAITRKSYTLYPKLGLQYMMTPITSLGLTIAKSQHVSGNLKVKVYQNATQNDGQTTDDGIPNDLQYNLSKDLYKQDIPKTEAYELSPLEVGFGIARFPTKYFMYTFDLNYYSADADFKEFKTVDVLNLALGLEYFLNDKKAIRLGIYTNNANTQKLSSTQTDQPPNVDMLGLTASYSVFSSGSALSFGTLYSTGKGFGQAVGGITSQQSVERNSMTVYLTGSYQM